MKVVGNLGIDVGDVLYRRAVKFLIKHHKMVDIDRSSRCQPLLKVVGKDYPGLHLH